MSEIEEHRAMLRELNRNYVRAVDEAELEIAWVEEHAVALVES
jgi:hypothetical protein